MAVSREKLRGQSQPAQPQGLKTEWVQGYLDELTMGVWWKTVEEEGSSAKWGKAKGWLELRASGAFHPL